MTHTLSSVTLGEALKQADNRLSKTSDTSKLDAEVLLCHVLNVGKTRLITSASDFLCEQDLAKFSRLLNRRANGEPVAYITGAKEFWSLEFRVSSKVLIPRPETELLVEIALDSIAELQTPRVLDLGTGSGAIAIAIAKERPDVIVVAVDASKSACDVARENVQVHSLTNIVVQHGSWFDSLEGQRFDLIVSNPPYIKADDNHLLQGDVRFEPAKALVAGKSGLDAITQILSEAAAYLPRNGVLAFEHGYDQAEDVEKLFEQNDFGGVSCRTDLGGRGRVTFGRIK